MLPALLEGLTSKWGVSWGSFWLLTFCSDVGLQGKLGMLSTKAAATLICRIALGALVNADSGGEVARCRTVALL